MLHPFRSLRPMMSGAAFTAMTLLAGFTLHAESPVETLVNATLQDEARRLPPDNTVLFTAASRSVSIQLDALDQVDDSQLAGTMLTVIDSQGQRRDFTADTSGVVTIDDVQPGPHAVVASNENAHGSTMLVFEEEGAQPNALADAAPVEPVGEGRMTLVRVNSEQLLPIVDRYLPPSSGLRAPFSTNDLVSPSGFGPSAFQVRVADDSILQGQVIPLVRSGTVGADVRGTALTLFRNGRPAGRGVADADGRFSIARVVPGTYGIVAAGPAGYAAFGFDVIRAAGVVKDSSPAAETHLVSTLATAQVGASPVADVLPVVLIPPYYMDQVLNTIRSFYGPLGGPLAGGIGPFGEFAPVPGAGGFGGGFGPGGFGPGGGFGGGGGGFGGAGGGLGGLGALAGLGAIGAVIAADDDDDFGPIFPPSVISPSQVVPPSN